MDFVVAQEVIAHTGRVGIVTALACVHCANSVHFISSQFKVKNVNVAGDALLIRRFWQDDKTFLNLKAQNYLTGVLAVFLSHFDDCGIFQKVSVAVTERIPRLKLYVVFVHKLAQFFLLEGRIAFDLIDGGQRGKLRHEFRINFR